MPIRVILLFLVAFSAGAVSKYDGLLGSKPAELDVSNWLNSKPLTLDALAGNVVLIRWWTAPDCLFCKASSVALNEWHERYSEKGLQVIGLYHHKTSSPLRIEDVEKYSKAFGFKFPIAVDNNWSTLRQWWLSDKRPWTSVSFLLDRQGVIRHVHPGGEYIKGDQAYREVDRTIRKLLSE